MVFGPNTEWRKIKQKTIQEGIRTKEIIIKVDKYQEKFHGFHKANGKKWTNVTKINQVSGRK